MYTNRSRKTRASIKAKKTRRRSRSRSQSRRLRRSRSRPTTLRGGKNSRSRETHQKHNVRNGLALAALGGAAVLGGLSLRALQRQNTNAQRQNRLDLRLLKLQEPTDAAKRQAREAAAREAREARQAAERAAAERAFPPREEKKATAYLKNITNKLEAINLSEDITKKLKDINTLISTLKTSNLLFKFSDLMTPSEETDIIFRELDYLVELHLLFTKFKQNTDTPLTDSQLPDSQVESLRPELTDRQVESLRTELELTDRQVESLRAERTDRKVESLRTERTDRQVESLRAEPELTGRQVESLRTEYVLTDLRRTISTPDRFFIKQHNIIRNAIERISTANVTEVKERLKVLAEAKMKFTAPSKLKYMSWYKTILKKITTCDALFQNIDNFVTKTLNVCKPREHLQGWTRELEGLTHSSSSSYFDAEKQFRVKFFENVAAIGDPKETGEFIDVDTQLQQINFIVNYSDCNASNSCPVLKRLNNLSSDVMSILRNRKMEDRTRPADGQRCDNQTAIRALKTVTRAHLMIEANKHYNPTYDQLTSKEQEDVNVFNDTRRQKQQKVLADRIVANRDLQLSRERNEVLRRAGS